MSGKQDIDKLLLLADGINGLVDVGEAIMEDGKISLGDINQLVPLKNEVEKIVKAVKEARELLEEAKDIDSAEAVQIVSALLKRK